MELEKQQIGNTLVVRVVGRLDVHTQEQLKSFWVEDVSSPYIVIDLSNTDFIDSVGLAALVSGLKTTRQRGGNLILVNPNEPIRLILDLTSMTRVFQIVPSLEDALAHIAAR